MKAYCRTLTSWPLLLGGVCVYQIDAAYSCDAAPFAVICIHIFLAQMSAVLRNHALALLSESSKQSFTWRTPRFKKINMIRLIKIKFGFIFCHITLPPELYITLYSCVGAPHCIAAISRQLKVEVIFISNWHNQEMFI